MLDDPREKMLVFLFGVLPVEDPILSVLHSAAAEDVPAMEAIAQIRTVGDVPCKEAEQNPVIRFEIRAIKLELAIVSEIHIIAIRIPLPIGGIAAALRIPECEARMAVVAMVELISSRVGAGEYMTRSVGIFRSECHEVMAQPNEIGRYEGFPSLKFLLRI